MVVVPVGLGLLGGDVRTQGGVQIGALQIVGGQGVACQQRLDIARPDDPAEGIPGHVVKGKGRTQHPDTAAAVFLLIAQQLHDLPVIPGKTRLPGAALAEGKVQTGALLAGKGVAVDVDALAAVLGAP